MVGNHLFDQVLVLVPQSPRLGYEDRGLLGSSIDNRQAALDGAPFVDAERASRWYGTRRSSCSRQPQGPGYGSRPGRDPVGLTEALTLLARRRRTLQRGKTSPGQ